MHPPQINKAQKKRLCATFDWSRQVFLRIPRIVWLAPGEATHSRRFGSTALARCPNTTPLYEVNMNMSYRTAQPSLDRAPAKETASVEVPSKRIWSRM
jgi:hypothetical protein